MRGLRLANSDDSHKRSTALLADWLYSGADKFLALPRRKQATATENVVVHILFIIIIGGILVLFICVTRLASNEIFSQSNKIHREEGRAKDLSAARYRTSPKIGQLTWEVSNVTVFTAQNLAKPRSLKKVLSTTCGPKFIQIG